MHRRLLLTAALALFPFAFAPSAAATQGAEIHTAQTFGYGRYEARLMFAPKDGVVSTYFLWKPGSELDGVFWAEADIEKIGANCSGYSSNARYGLPAENYEQKVNAGFDLCLQYHTHSLEWTPTYVSWSIDGVEYRRLEGETATAFANNTPDGVEVHFNVWQGNSDFGGTLDPASLPVHQFVNWVQFSEYTPGSGDAGGDFAVSFRDDFDTLTADWISANWESPFGLSTHNPLNVTTVDGVLVLSLTENGAEGYAGTPPSDPGVAPSPLPSTGGSAGIAMEPVPVDPVDGGLADANSEESIGTPDPNGASSSGACNLGAKQSSAPGWLVPLASASALVLARRWARRAQAHFGRRP